jgi:hypothetical protein
VGWYTTFASQKRERRKINKAISLAFLAPELVRAALEGPLPHGMAVARLFDLPAEWSHQRPGGTIEEEKLITIGA